MNPGRLNRRVTIRVPTKKKNPLGQSVTEYQYLVRVWASIKPKSTGEEIDSGTHQSDITHEIKIRYREGIAPHAQFLRGEKTFEMIGLPINQYDHNRYLICQCKEVI